MPGISESAWLSANVPSVPIALSTTIKSHEQLLLQVLVMSRTGDVEARQAGKLAQRRDEILHSARRQGIGCHAR